MGSGGRGLKAWGFRGCGRKGEGLELGGAELLWGGTKGFGSCFPVWGVVFEEGPRPEVVFYGALPGAMCDRKWAAYGLAP